MNARFFLLKHISNVTLFTSSFSSSHFPEQRLNIVNAEPSLLLLLLVLRVGLFSVLLPLMNVNQISTQKLSVL